MASKNLENVSREELAQGATASPDPKVERFVARIQNLHMSHSFSHVSHFLTCLTELATHVSHFLISPLTNNLQHVKAQMGEYPASYCEN